MIKEYEGTPGGGGIELTDRERDFLLRVQRRFPLRPADREEDRVRQVVRRRGLAEMLSNPRRWALTPAGRAALERGDG